MKYIIDGYNMIRKIDALRAHDAKSLEKGRQALIQKLSRFRIGSKAEITVVFDGQKSSLTSQSGITIRFSNLPNKADEMIKKLVDQNKKAQETTVVSSDREVMVYAKGCGCKTQRSEDFYKKIDQTKTAGIIKDLEEKHDPQLSSKDIGEWMKIFNSK
jgi:predicted RNA-binding protein with PIN domain